MGRASSMNGGEEECILYIGGKARRDDKVNNIVVYLPSTQELLNHRNLKTCTQQ
jgi:hypothetical protein